MQRHRRSVLAAFVVLCGGVEAFAADGPTVFAAASMAGALEAAGIAHAAAGGRPVTFSFAGSGALARQIEAGAPADAFVSADLAWMDWAAERNLIDPSTRRIIAGNALVLIAPTDAAPAVDLADPASLSAAFDADDRLAMGDPQSVPAGAYAAAAIEATGLGDVVRDRLAFTETVRVALALVSRGEAALGIVYASDAAADPGVTVVATFPDDSHAPIVYPAAVTAGADDAADAAAFLDFLASDGGQAILARYGFRSPPGDG